jgi:hypothetical protein
MTSDSERGFDTLAERMPLARIRPGTHRTLRRSQPRTHRTVGSPSSAAHSRRKEPPYSHSCKPPEHRHSCMPEHSRSRKLGRSRHRRDKPGRSHSHSRMHRNTVRRVQHQ